MAQHNITAFYIPNFLAERQRMLAGNQFESVGYGNYVDYSDSGNFGFYLLKIASDDDLIKTCTDEMISVYLKEGQSDKVDVMTLAYTEEILNLVRVEINLKNIMFDTMFLFDQLFEKEDYSMEIMKYNLVSKHLQKMMKTENLYRKMFPKGLLTNHTMVYDWVKAINNTLSDLVSPDQTFLVRTVMKIKKEDVTIGDFLLGTFVRRKATCGNLNVNTRLMIFALSCLCLADEEGRNYLITSIYNWIALNGCDSCAEKAFREFVHEHINGTMDLNYDHSNLTKTSSRNLEFDVDFCYKIYRCRSNDDGSEGTDFMPVSSSVIPIYSHSALVIKSIRSVVTVKIFGNPIDLSFHRGVSLFRAVGLYVSSVKDSHLSKRNDILSKRIDFMNGEATNNGYDGNVINEMIIDLAELFFYFPALSHLSKRLMFVLFYAAIPFQVMATFTFTGDDYYSSALDSLLKANWQVFERDSFNFFLSHHLNLGHMKAVLNSNVRLVSLWEA